MTLIYYSTLRLKQICSMLSKSKYFFMDIGIFNLKKPISRKVELSTENPD
jgi:hypothetical protein